jgi:UDP-2,4-diacetamido-2,4,6-trideoxy-beta-L-altropyranose hydrolase
MTGARSLTLRPAVAGDVLTIFDWQKDPNTRRFARNAAAPSLHEHRAWYAQKLASADCRFWIALHNGSPCGFVRLDRHGAEWEVSIVVAPEKHGMGIGRQILEALDGVASGIALVAEVLPGQRIIKKALLCGRLSTLSG